MEFYLKSNIDFKSIFLESRETIFTKEFRILLLFILLVLLELPIFFILIKMFADKALFITFLLLFIASLLVIFISIFFFASPKLFLFYADKEKGKLRLGWIKYLVFKSFQEILFEDIASMYAIILPLEKSKRVALNIKRVSGQTINLSFITKNFEDDKEISRLIINLSNIIGFLTYTAFYNEFALKIEFSKNDDLANKTYDLDNIVFVREENKNLASDILIPDIKVEVRDHNKVFITRKPNFYDAIRMIAFFVFFPLIMIIALISKDPYKYYAIFVSLVIYSSILFFFNKYFVPIRILLDRSSGELLVSRAFFWKRSFYLANVREIEIKDFRLNRMGTLIFEVSALLNSSKKILLFFVETSISNKRNDEIFVNILSFVKYLVSNYNIPIKDSCKSIANI